MSNDEDKQEDKPTTKDTKKETEEDNGAEPMFPTVKKVVNIQTSNDLGAILTELRMYIETEQPTSK